MQRNISAPAVLRGSHGEVNPDHPTHTGCSGDDEEEGGQN